MNDCLPIKTSWVQFYVLCDSLCHVNTCEPVVSSEYSLFGSVGRTSALLEARRLPEQPEEVQERSHLSNALYIYYTEKLVEVFPGNITQPQSYSTQQFGWLAYPPKI